MKFYRFDQFFSVLVQLFIYDILDTMIITSDTSFALLEILCPYISSVLHCTRTFIDAV